MRVVEEQMCFVFFDAKKLRLCAALGSSEQDLEIRQPSSIQAFWFVGQIS